MGADVKTEGSGGVDVARESNVIEPMNVVGLVLGIPVLDPINLTR